MSMMDMEFSFVLGVSFSVTTRENRIPFSPSGFMGKPTPGSRAHAMRRVGRKSGGAEDVLRAAAPLAEKASVEGHLPRGEVLQPTPNGDAAGGDDLGGVCQAIGEAIADPRAQRAAAPAAARSALRLVAI
jgi:hypothetical protein